MVPSRHIHPFPSACLSVCCGLMSIPIPVEKTKVPMPNRVAALRASRSYSGGQRKRVLIVNCYFDDDSRQPRPRPRKLPKAMGTVYLAGAFAPELCDVRVYCELQSGPLEDPDLLGWPDMLVLTGLTTSFDRMLHVTAYARTLNQKVVVVAGGPGIRALPRFSKRFFDYPCTGDVEQLRDVIREVFGSAFIAEEMHPRFDLAHWIDRVGEMESSRNCNFRCSFCSLSAEGRGYQKYDIETIRRHILAIGKRDYLLFIDNNFYGNDRSFFLDRVNLLREMWHANQFGNWTALVTNDFFLRKDNLVLARESGCTALFSGVESFDSEWLQQMNKLQNTCLPQVEMIRECLEGGIVFLYGLILDVTTRSVSDLRRELEFITGNSEITLPAYLSLTVPFPGTPFFQECVAKDLFLPRVALRDLDSTTLVLKPRDSFGEVCQFLDDVHTMRGLRRRILGQSLGFVRRYRKFLTPRQMVVALTSPTLLCFYSQATSGGVWESLRKPAVRRTHLAPTESMDSTYNPAFPVASRYAHYFKPTMLTNDSGSLNEELTMDLLDVPEKRIVTPAWIPTQDGKQVSVPASQSAD